MSQHLIPAFEMAGLDSLHLFLLYKLCSAWRLEQRRLTCALIQEELDCTVMFWE